MSAEHYDLTDARYLKEFLDNVRFARGCGYELVCSDCGQGILDESDTHEWFCSYRSEESRSAARSTMRALPAPGSDFGSVGVGEEPT